MMRRDTLISVIVTSYKRPDVLALVLDALSRQTDSRFDLVVADDGSQRPSRDLLDIWRGRLPCLIRHVGQEDRGFRAALARRQNL